MRSLPRRSAAAVARGWAVLSRPIAWVCALVAMRPVAVVIVFLFVAAFIANGAIGIDFGSHWDEWYHVSVVAQSVQRMTLLPEAYAYGGPYFTLGYPIIVANQWKNVLAILNDLRTQPPMMDPSTFPSVQHFKDGAAALFGTATYVLQVRTMFMVVSSLSIFWAFGAVLRCWPRRYGVALAGAAFMGFCWEIGYHARWIAIDAPLAQFCALELFFYCAAWKAPSDGPFIRWYSAAAAAAGAVFACKMTGGFAFLPIFLTPLVRRSYWTAGRRVRVAALGTAIFIVSSFVLSPNFYLYPMQFLHIIRGGDYNSVGPTYPQYVTFFEHAWRMVVWMVGAVPSPFRSLAFTFSGIVLLGFIDLIRHERRMTLCWLVFMVSFAAIFTHNHLFMVRNFLMFIPFLALCFARGTAIGWDFLQEQVGMRLGAAFAVLVAVALMTNAVFEWKQAWHIAHDTPDSVSDAAAQDLLSERQPVRMSAPVLERMRSRLGDAYTCHPADLKDPRIQHFLALQLEHEWMSNRLGYFRHVYGAAALNLQYYATWFGRERNFRLVDVPMEAMNFFHHAVATDVDCFPTGKPGPRR